MRHRCSGVRPSERSSKAIVGGKTVLPCTCICTCAAARGPGCNKRAREKRDTGRLGHREARATGGDAAAACIVMLRASAAVVRAVVGTGFAAAMRTVVQRQVVENNIQTGQP